MTRRFRASWKAVVGWTLFFHLVALVAVVRYRVTRTLQKPWAEQVSGRSASASAADSPRTVEMDREDVDGMVEGAIKAWNGRAPSERLRALEARGRELEGMDPENLGRIVARLRDRVPDADHPVVPVELTKLNLDRSVPVDMRRGENEKGRPGVWIAMMDDQRQVAEMWMADEELGPEERRALQAFEMMERHPALRGLQPVLFELLSREGEGGR